MGAAAVRGYQPGPRLREACVADGGTEGGRDQGDARIDEGMLRVIHFFGYPSAVAAGAATAMASFSSWNGQKMHGHCYLFIDVFKGELGFGGFVVSDWGGVD
jgi:beta-glucosidase